MALKIAALFVAVITVGLWFFGGFNLGRTRGMVPVERSGGDGRIELVHEARFLPGIDFLAAGLALCVALLGASRFVGGSGKSPMRT